MQRTAAARALRERLRVHRVGAQIVICPPWRDYAPRSDDVVIALDPGLAFGDGLHPSTQLCLLALEERLWPGMRVLDVGCGSGILTVAAARLGAASVDALDLEPLAVRVTRENVARNELVTPVRVKVGTVEATADFSRRYDLVVANIITGTIARLAPELVGALAPGGWLLTSGITADRAAVVHEALAAAGLAELEHRRLGDWTLVEGIRNAERGARSAEQGRTGARRS